ncbi:MAG: hypothetical protein ACFE0I_14710 [Elainellaceae cyanobacterium]
MSSVNLPEDYPDQSGPNLDTPGIRVGKGNDANRTIREYQGANDRVVEESTAQLRGEYRTDDTELKVDILGYSRRTHEENTNPGEDANFDAASGQFQGSLVSVQGSHDLGEGWKTNVFLNVGNASGKTIEDGSSSLREGKASLIQRGWSITNEQGDGITWKHDAGSVGGRYGMVNSEDHRVINPLLLGGAANLSTDEIIVQKDGIQVEAGIGIGFDKSLFGKRRNRGGGSSNNGGNDDRNSDENSLITDLQPNSSIDILGFISYENRSGVDTDGDGRGEFGHKVSVTVPIYGVPVTITGGGFEEKSIEQRISAIEEPLKMEKTEGMLSEINQF